MPHAEIVEAIWGCGFEDRTDSGEFSAEEYLDKFGEQIGFPISRQQWCEYRKSGMTPHLEVLEAAQIWSRQVPVGILTNNGFLLVEEIDTLFPELRPIFGENVFCSAQFGVRKPDLNVFLQACVALRTNPTSTLCIDDRLENVQAAITVGLGGYHFTSSNQFLGDLVS